MASTIIGRLLGIIGGRRKKEHVNDDKTELASPSLDYKAIPEYIWSDLAVRMNTANELYEYLDHYYKNRAPEILREHRRYFQADRRGFGEDAFHAMWWLLLLEYRPSRCLEIGVYRGQVISLWTQIFRMIHQDAEIWGITPAVSANDSVSKYPDEVDYIEDINANFQNFGLPAPNILKSYSTDTAAKDFIQSKSWDLVYIDGSHDEADVRSDYMVSRDSLRQGGLLVFDDAALKFGYSPKSGSFAGHPGPSEIAFEVAAKEMDLLGVIGHNVVFKKR